jgi:hypothetical protein
MDKVKCSAAAADLLMSMLQARHLCMTDSYPLTCWKAVVKSVDGTLRSLLPGVTPDPVFEPAGADNQVTTSSPYPEIRIGTRGYHACLNAADCFLNYGTKRIRKSYSPATPRTTMMWLRYDLGNPCHVLMEVTFPAGTYHVNAQGSVVGSEFRAQRVLSHDETVKEVLAQAPGSQFAVIADKNLLLKRFHQNPRHNPFRVHDQRCGIEEHPTRGFVLHGWSAFTPTSRRRPLVKRKVVQAVFSHGHLVTVLYGDDLVNVLTDLSGKVMLDMEVYARASLFTPNL